MRDQTRLQANLVQSARNRAAEAIKSVVARWQNGKKASQPHFTPPSVRYDKQSATFHDNHVSLSTVNWRIEAEYVLPPEGDNPQTKSLRNDEYEVTGATLQYRDATDTFDLHIGTKADVESEISNEGDAEHSTVLGVGLGIEQIAVTSTGQFWSGTYLNHRRREYERGRGDLQWTGTESAHRTIGTPSRRSRSRYSCISGPPSPQPCTIGPKFARNSRCSGRGGHGMQPVRRTPQRRSSAWRRSFLLLWASHRTRCSKKSSPR